VLVVFVLNLVFNHFNAFPRRTQEGVVETTLDAGAVVRE
jgi:hypothetical protein